MRLSQPNQIKFDIQNRAIEREERKTTRVINKKAVEKINCELISWELSVAEIYRAPFKIRESTHKS